MRKLALFMAVVAVGLLLSLPTAARADFAVAILMAQWPMQ